MKTFEHISLHILCSYLDSVHGRELRRATEILLAIEVVNRSSKERKEKSNNSIAINNSNDCVQII